MFYSSKRKIKWFLLLISSMKLSLLYISSMMRGHLLKRDLIMCGGGGNVDDVGIDGGGGFGAKAVEDEGGGGMGGEDAAS